VGTESSRSALVSLSVATFLMSLGENLWKKFLPKYLESLGAPVTVIGLFGTTEDFLDGVYQYPGGWVGDRLGRRLAMLLFVSIAIAGYAVYWFAPSWPWLFVGLVLVMAWSSMASPTLFSVIGDALPSRERARGFAVQSLLRRLPITVAPALGGLIIASRGLQAGIHASLIVTIALAALTLAACAFISIPIIPDPSRRGIAGIWKSLPRELRRLLLSDVFIRTCEGMVDVFLVLYAINVIGIRAPQFGVLIAVEMIAAIVAYLPAVRIAGAVGRKPLVIATFVFFALFPIAVVLSRSFSSLVVAFVVAGLREVGEPARKAMIVDMVHPALRARSIGLYYLIRSVAISPAAFAGGLLWNVRPALPFEIAGVIGLAGTVVFALTVDERYAA
jgi:MFS family permease